MEWLQRLNESLIYLEEHIADTIAYEEAARIACCSTFHYQRMFTYIAGMPLSEYVRRRRMTAAAFDLQSGGMKVIDVSLKYGYDSPTAFNRAFQSVHGVPPSAAREEGVSLKAYPRISFAISIKGEAEMNYKIEKRDAIRIVGVKEHMDLNVEENFANVPLFWQKTIQSGIVPTIIGAMDNEPYGLLGVSTCMNGKDFDYYIAAASGKPLPLGLEEYLIPAGTWAIFDCVGPMPHAVQDLQKRIVIEWLPVSGYEYADAPDIEVYPEGDQSAIDYRCQIWLPVVKKG